MNDYLFNKDDVIRYLRGLVDDLESGKAELLEYSQEFELSEGYAALGIPATHTGKRTEIIRWKLNK